MALPIEQTRGTRLATTFEQELTRLQAAPEERARILASSPPFDYEVWVREAGPAKPEELAEMEEFLRGREEERARSLAREEERLASVGQ